MKVDDKLINEFRDYVNGNSSFVFETYHDQNGKNLWNIICSCMDWISVAVRFLEANLNLDKNIDVRVMQFFNIISAIDIVTESVTQLDRCINQSKKVPFHGKKDIFRNNFLELDDNSYFKEIRAMFGAHPVNLKQDNNQKRFASWPYDQFTNGDSTFELKLYSNNPENADISVGVNIDDIETFLLERYSFLNSLICNLDNQFDQYCKKLSCERIVTYDDPIKNILNLEIESKKRLNDEYYNGIINHLKRIYLATLEEDELKAEEEKYKIELSKVIHELTINLQNMDFIELENYQILNPDYPYSKIGYSVSHLFTYDFDYRSEPLFDFHMKEFDDFSNNRYNFINTNEADLVFLKMKMMLFRMSKKNIPDNKQLK